MDVERWLAFFVASLLIAILPGPGVANIVGYALSSGRNTAFGAIAVAVAGSITAMLVSLAGIGALVAAFPRAFTLVELAGAAYLVLLGLTGLARNEGRGPVGEAGRAPIPPGAAFTGSIAVSALNPSALCLRRSCRVLLGLAAHAGIGLARAACSGSGSAEGLCGGVHRELHHRRSDLPGDWSAAKRGPKPVASILPIAGAALVVVAIGATVRRRTGKQDPTGTQKSQEERVVPC